MAIDFTAKYPGRFDPVSALYPQGKFKNRSAPNTEDGSYMERDWLNDWNGFFGALLKNAGVAPNGTVDTATASQLYDALRLVTGDKYGSALIGSLVYWPLQQMPQEIFTDLGQVYIPYIAQAFDPVKYPLLKMLHPSGALPADMRGEFPRGWDNGRGIDSGRALMSAQADAARKIQGSVSSVYAPVTSPQSGALTITVFGQTPAKAGVIGGDPGSNVTINFDSSLANPANTSTENRSRNIAWNMIVRAA